MGIYLKALLPSRQYPAWRLARKGHRVAVQPPATREETVDLASITRRLMLSFSHGGSDGGIQEGCQENSTTGCATLLNAGFLLPAAVLSAGLEGFTLGVAVVVGAGVIWNSLYSYGYTIRIAAAVLPVDAVGHPAFDFW